MNTSKVMTISSDEDSRIWMKRGRKSITKNDIKEKKKEKDKVRNIEPYIFDGFSLNQGSRAEFNKKLQAIQRGKRNNYKQSIKILQRIENYSFKLFSQQDRQWFFQQIKMAKKAIEKKFLKGEEVILLQ